MQFTLRKLLAWCVCAFVRGLGVGYGLVHVLADRTSATPSALQPP